ncbi:hypothetical protein SAMN05660742_1098 [Propionispira arboris]|uniref:DUF7336 domain-containing protein n=1 Tax=Propionispira arboris TaxID=84035 RepID=A0A1H6Z9E1_9FIRM|nr:hypothetical protein [Propionispira arboris]SEJ50049.1 hypothetical protein SAMN05660742_1098 [Propionispira arboris]
MGTVYILQHSYEVGEDGQFDEIKMIGVYSSRESAEKTIVRYKMLSGFKDYPISCFYISKYEIDKDHWTDGFIKTDEALL